MALENLKSIFAEGVGNNATSPEGRHGADTGTLVGQLPNDYSQLDNFSPFMSTFQINSNSSPLINLIPSTVTNSEPAFPQTYTPINTLVNGEFKSDVTETGDVLINHGWFDLYNSNHTSIAVNNPSPKSSNPFQPFQYGNSRIGTLNIKSRNADNGSSGLSRGNEPYIVSRIGGHGRRLNRGSRLFPRKRAATDFKRISRYLRSPAGLLDMALKNAHFFIDEVVVRDRNKLIKVRQRFNAGYNPLSTLGSIRLRFIGQGLPQKLFDSGISKDYGHEVGSFLSPLEKLADNGDIPSTAGGRVGAKKGRSQLGTPYDLFFLRDTFTQAEKDVYNKELPDKKLNEKAYIKKVTTGDKMTLAPIVQGITLDTTTAKATTFKGDAGGANPYDSVDLGFNINETKEGMPLYFKDLRNDSYIFFRAYLEGITEDITPSWSEHNYVGRSESVYVYERATRTITFSLKLVAQTEYELQAIYRKMNHLTSMCYPEYAQDVRMGDKTRMKPPLAKLRLGEMFGGQTVVTDSNPNNKEMLGFIEALNYIVPESSTWETISGKRVPKHITANITWKALHTTPPEMFDNFYGYNGEDGAFMPDVDDNQQQKGITGIKEPDASLRRTRKWNSPRKTESETTKKTTEPTNAE